MMESLFKSYSDLVVGFSRYTDYILWDQGGELRQEGELAKMGQWWNHCTLISQLGSDKIGWILIPTGLNERHKN